MSDLLFGSSSKCLQNSYPMFVCEFTEDSTKTPKPRIERATSLFNGRSPAMSQKVSTVRGSSVASVVPTPIPRWPARQHRRQQESGGQRYDRWKYAVNINVHRPGPLCHQRRRRGGRGACSETVEDASSSQPDIRLKSKLRTHRQRPAQKYIITRHHEVSSSWSLSVDRSALPHTRESHRCLGQIRNQLVVTQNRVQNLSVADMDHWLASTPARVGLRSALRRGTQVCA